MQINTKRKRVRKWMINNLYIMLIKTTHTHTLSYYMLIVIKKAIMTSLIIMKSSVSVQF